MSLQLRVAIIIMVVITCLVSIIALSICTRIYHERHSANKQIETTDDYLIANGYLPQSRQSFASISATIGNGDAFYIKPHRKSRSSTGTVTSPSTTSAKDTPMEG